MIAKIDEVKTDGIVTRDELLAMGCTEDILRGGRKFYVKNGSAVASECTKCKSIKKLKGFGKHLRLKYSIRSECKECRSKYHEENRERLLGIMQRNYEKNKGQRLEYTRKYREEHKEYFIEYNRKYREENPDYYYNYGRENREKKYEYNKKFREDNKDKYTLYSQRRRALKRALPYDETEDQRAKVWKDFGYACALTGNPLDVQADHTIPIDISHGGTTYGNMIPLSAPLNYSKNNRHIFEWFDANKVRYNLEQSRFDALIVYLADANEMSPTEYRKYTDWCFDNPRVIDEASGELVFINERKAIA